VPRNSTVLRNAVVVTCQSEDESHVRAIMTAMREHRGRAQRLRRRIVSVPAVLVVAPLLTITTPLWAPAAAIADLVRGRRRLPLVRLLAFGTVWAWAECAGIARSLAEWVRGNAGDHDRHYALMGWWAGTLMRGLRATTGLRVEVDGVEAFTPGPAVVLSRHASYGDSLVSAWVLCCLCGLQPRYVLKRELLSDPCLDIVGLRVPNHFLDREAADGDAELEALSELSTGLGPASVAVIFPEGTRASDAKRARAIAKIAERNPERAARMAGLRHLLPPRPAGSRAILRGAPDADLVLVWHAGFDGLDTIGGIVDRLRRAPRPITLVARRVARGDVPEGADFDRWLDDQWLRMDAAVDAELGRP